MVLPLNFKMLQVEGEQVMITLRGMAEHRFSNVYNFQYLTLVLYLLK